MKCLMNDGVQPEDCEHMKRNGGLHCFCVRVCVQASALVVEVGAKLGRKMFDTITEGNDLDSSIQAESVEFEAVTNMVSAGIITVMSGAQGKMIWHLADAVIDMLGTRAAQKELPACFKIDGELGALLSERIDRMPVHKRPKHMKMYQASQDEVGLN